MPDYIQSILLNPELPLEAKTIALKLYGVNDSHIISALNSNSPELRKIVYNHDLFDKNILDNINGDNRFIIISELLSDKSNIISKDNLSNLYEEIFNWAEKDPEKAKEILFNFHEHPCFSYLDQGSLNKIKSMALSPFGSVLGIDSFFIEDNQPRNGIDSNESFIKSIDQYANAMQFLHGIGELKNIKDSENDYRSTALQSYGYANSKPNRRILDIVSDFFSIKKEKPEPIQGEYQVQPKNPIDENVAVLIQKCFNNRNVNKAHFIGKHIGGSLIASDPESGNSFLLKKNDSKLSPAKGVNEEKADQNQREFAFVQMAKFFGLHDFFPQVNIVFINSKEYAAINLIGHGFEPAADLYDKFPNKVKEIFEKYRSTGILTKLAVLDYVLGNPDRHGHNILLNPDDNQMVLIDHGSAFAGVSFNPGMDENSFVPYYLRYRNLLEFPEMNLNQKSANMPVPVSNIDDMIKTWICNIDQDYFIGSLRACGIMTKASEIRLQLIKSNPGNISSFVNSLWIK